MWCGICPVLCRMLSCVSGLYPLSISSTPSLPMTPFWGRQPILSSGVAKRPQRAKLPLVECYGSYHPAETIPRFLLVIWEAVEPPCKTGDQEREAHAGQWRRNWFMRFPIIVKCRFADWEHERINFTILFKVNTLNRIFPCCFYSSEVLFIRI